MTEHEWEDQDIKVVKLYSGIMPTDVVLVFKEDIRDVLLNRADIIEICRRMEIQGEEL